MPSPLAQLWLEVSWNPPSPVLNRTAMVTATARVTTATASPRASCSQDGTFLSGTRATTAAPMAGVRTRTVSKGKGVGISSTTAG